MQQLLLTLQADTEKWERFKKYYCKSYFGMTEEKHADSSFNFHFENGFPNLPEFFQLAALVDWLDSEGVYLNIEYDQEYEWQFNIEGYGDCRLISRHEALKAGITYAIPLLK